MVLAGLIGRLPMGMVGLGLTLMVVGVSSSYALASAVAATSTVSLALVGPRVSRVVDRVGQTKALPRILAVHTAALLLLTASVTLGLPEPLWFLFAAIAGASIPNLGAMTRSRWVRISRNGAERSSAFAMESVVDEMVFVMGPVLASALALAFFPAAPVLVAMAAALIGGLWLASQRSTAPPPAGTAPAHLEDGNSAKRSPLRFPGLVWVFFLMLAMGAVFGSLNVSIVAFAQETAPAMTGFMLAALSLGSLLSGLVLGAMTRTWTLTGQVRSGLVTLTLALTPLVAMAVLGIPALFAVMAFFAGLSVSVVMVGAFGLAERLVPNRRLTESLSIMASGLSLGMAVALPSAGLLIDHVGTPAAMALSAGFATVGALMFWVRSPAIRRLEEASDSREAAEVDEDEERALSRTAPSPQ